MREWARDALLQSKRAGPLRSPCQAAGPREPLRAGLASAPAPRARAPRAAMSRHHHEDPDPDFVIDLHGRRPADALRHLEHELHAARVKRVELVRVVTGRGWGNLDQKPVLRPQVEAWLLAPTGRRLGVESVTVVSNGGALDVRLSIAGGQR